MSFPHILIPAAAQVWHLNDQLKNFEKQPRQEQLRVQGESLTNLFKWSFEYSQFWREQLEKVHWKPNSNPWNILQQLPVLHRKDIQERYAELSCEHALDPKSCKIAHSTGSTGAPVQVLKHGPSYLARYLAHNLRSTIWSQLDVSQPILKFGARVKDQIIPNWGAPESLFNNTGMAILFNSVDHNLDEMYAQIQNHRPKYVVGDASVIKGLIDRALLEDPQRRPKINGFITTGATVSKKLRQDSLNVYNAKIFDRYTSEEVGWIASQCPKHHHLHVMSGNVVVEIINELGQPCSVGEPGRVLVTALHSEAMPLIRYEIGDIAEWGHPCDCGIQFPVLGRIWGRERDFIKAPTGEMRYIVIFAEAFLSIAPIRDMRFRYYSNPLLRVELVCDTPLTAPQEATLTTEIYKMIGFQCPLEIEIKEKIEWGMTDKRIAFMNMKTTWNK